MGILNEYDEQWKLIIIAIFIVGIQSDSADSTKSVAERVRLAEEMKKLTNGEPRVTLTSSQSFNYPSRGKESIF